MKEVLDSKFLIVFAFADDEPTRSRARSKLSALRRERRGVLPCVVLAEVTKAICQKAGIREARAYFRALEHAGLEVVPLDSALAHEAGLIQCAHRTLPMADCIIAATALRVRGPIVTDDPHFSGIEGVRTVWI